DRRQRAVVPPVEPGDRVRACRVVVHVDVPDHGREAVGVRRGGVPRDRQRYGCGGGEQYETWLRHSDLLGEPGRIPRRRPRSQEGLSALLRGGEGFLKPGSTELRARGAFGWA